MATKKRTKGQLAVLLGISEEQFRQDRLQPDAPKGLDPVKWIAWRAKRGRQRAGRSPINSDPSSDTIGERKLREEVRALTLANDAREKRHQIEATRISEEVVAKLVSQIRSATVGTLPGKVIEYFKSTNRDQDEAAVRGMVEDVLRGIR